MFLHFLVILVLDGLLAVAAGVFVQIGDAHGAICMGLTAVLFTLFQVGSRLNHQ